MNHKHDDDEDQLLTREITCSDEGLHSDEEDWLFQNRDEL